METVYKVTVSNLENEYDATTQSYYSIHTYPSSYLFDFPSNGNLLIFDKGILKAAYATGEWHKVFRVED